ncbi:15744_t:CDS:2 [Entrophospora sp. SA101]|nr:15744_t:CDS:2 [Entrophospora sp. SA101]
MPKTKDVLTKVAKGLKDISKQLKNARTFHIGALLALFDFESNNCFTIFSDDALTVFGKCNAGNIALSVKHDCSGTII